MKGKVMCYAGGPYCEKDISKALRQAKGDYEDNPSTKIANKIAGLQEKMKMTPTCIERLKKVDSVAGAKAEQEYANKLASAKRYARMRKDTSRQMKETKSELNDVTERLQKLKTFQESLNKRDLNELSADEGSKREQLNGQLNEKINQEEQRRKLLVERTEVINQNNQNSLQNHKDGKEISYGHMMPEKFADYFKSTEKKHFSHDSPGSTFTEAKNLNQVLDIANQQRGGLHGDDRDELIKHGADPSSFNDDKRYLMVRTNGTVGSVDSKALPEDTILTVHQKAEGVDPLCVAEVSSKPQTDIGTIVVVDNPTLKGTEKYPSLLITAYPGVSGANSSSESLLPYVGQKISMKQAREIFEGQEFSVNTVLKK